MINIKFEDELKKYNILNYLQKETIIEYNNLKSNKNYVNFSYENEYFQKYNSFYWIDLIKNNNDKRKTLKIL